MQYRPEIDGLRALAVVPVILFHSGWESFSGGFVGVDIFFVISGYLITSIILAEHASGKFSFVTFYERRARRILPALCFVLLCCLPMAWLWMLPSEMAGFAKSILSISTFTSNLYFRAETDYFGTAAEENPLLHTWSLAVEEQYYFLFPLVISMLWRTGKSQIGAALSVIAVLSLAFADWQVASNPDQIFFDTRARVWELLAGALAAIYLFSPSAAAKPKIAPSLALLGLGMILYSVFSFDEMTPSPGAFTLLPVTGTVLLVLFSNTQNLAGKVLSSRPLVGIGLISYSAYLWHQPLLAFARLRAAEDPDVYVMAVCVGLTLLLAYLTWRYVEQPFRDRTRVSRRSVGMFSVTASVSMALTGFAGIASGGFEWRFDRNTLIAENFSALLDERGEITRAGECQYSRKLNNNSFDAFLRAWNCDGDSHHPELQKLPVIVAGDSHSADVAAALRTNGYTPVQIGAPGCSVVPGRMSPSCNRIFSFIKEFAARKPEYTHFVLANRWDHHEVKPAQLEKMISYWSIPGKKLIFVSSRPEFHGFKKAIRQGRSLKPNFNRAATSSSAAVTDFLRTQGVTFVNSRNLYCSITPDCGFKDQQGRLLMVDGNHFSRRGAQLFGEKLLGTGVMPGVPLKG